MTWVNLMMFVNTSHPVYEDKKDARPNGLAPANPMPTEGMDLDKMTIDQALSLF